LDRNCLLGIEEKFPASRMGCRRGGVYAITFVDDLKGGEKLNADDVGLILSFSL
jgi:uncharacterized protein (DUF2141 family)